MTKGSTDPRIEHILETLLAIAGQDFAARAPVGQRGDTLDAIAQAVNMVAEELADAVASRRELEMAHEHLKQAQAQLAHAGKLAAIGRLASGVAHEINNPATAAMLTIAVSRRRVEALRPHAGGAMLLGLDEVMCMLEDAGEALDRIRTVTGDLSTFARADHDVRECLLVNDVVEIACRLAAPTIRPRAHLAVALGEVAPVLASRARLGQVVSNLLSNAVQAIPEKAPDPIIEVTTAQRGDRVEIAVADSGPGIPEDLRDRVFEPFFTTKAPGEGTGLGLAMVQAIVRAHGGSVAIGDSPRGGAAVVVSLPGHQDRPVRPSRAHSEPAVEQRARVLLVDDEPMLLAALAAWLEEWCDVCQADGGTQALELLAQDDAFDLILCDLHMPGIDGIAVYRALQERAPRLLERFAFTSGGAVTESSQQFLHDVRPRVLHKPFSEKELQRALREAHARR